MRPVAAATRRLATPCLLIRPARHRTHPRRRPSSARSWTRRHLHHRWRVARPMRSVARRRARGRCSQSTWRRTGGRTRPNPPLRTSIAGSLASCAWATCLIISSTHALFKLGGQLTLRMATYLNERSCASVTRLLASKGRSTCTVSPTRSWPSVAYTVGRCAARVCGCNAKAAG